MGNRLIGVGRFFRRGILIKLQGTTTARVTALSRQELIREYPIEGLADGWYFKIEERSAGNYLVEGKDIWGRIISRQGMEDPEQTLQECVRDANQLRASSAG